ncbi:MAG: right-handed parallel beta-helix repeat-containing protein [Alkalibacterium sp.]|nr:right-handed parallel beta-helix repeat-containing protein [Alkalibacterium sp.]
MAQAATPWTPPTADQPGLIGPHWSKGWIIENNDIHDAKCSGISMGKEHSTGDNYSSKRRDKPGYHYQIETVFEAEKAGWSKEKVGSHIIRNNVIHDCGQNGVVGHLGCIFSEVSGNHIYNIAIKRQFYGHEIAGIKLHAAIDTQIEDNRIHDCTLGIWLDWQLQGTRVTRNLFYRNSRDLFVEVSSGPFIIDHNILTAALRHRQPCPGRRFRQQYRPRTHGTPKNAGPFDALSYGTQHGHQRLLPCLRWRRPLVQQHLYRR